MASLIALNKMVAVGILEVRVREETENKVMKGLGLKGWKMIKNGNSKECARIWVLFDDSKVKIRLLSVGVQWLHCEILFGVQSFYWNIVYGLYDRRSRQEL